VTGSLSQQQREALALYLRLLDDHPGLFVGRARRPIISDPATLQTYAVEHQVVLGVAFATPYLWLINDLVQSQDASGTPLMHPYLRLISPPDATAAPGVVALATIPAPGSPSGERVVLVEQERHATGTVELELPRGFGDPGISPAAQALRELRQETGYIGADATYLGTTLTDSGSTDRSAAFFHIPVTSRAAEQPETQEAILRTVLLTVNELWKKIDSGAVHDAFTVQALAFYERWTAMKDTANGT
jgi:ADP-ribose pyrophosphatase